MNKLFERYKKLLAASLAALSWGSVYTSGTGPRNTMNITRKSKSVNKKKKNNPNKKIDEETMKLTIENVKRKIYNDPKAVFNYPSRLFLGQILKEQEKLKNMPENSIRKQIVNRLAFLACSGKELKFMGETSLNDICKWYEVTNLKPVSDSHLISITNKLFSLRVEGIYKMTEKFKTWLEGKSDAFKHEILDYLLKNKKGSDDDAFSKLLKLAKDNLNTHDDTKLADVLRESVTQFWFLGPELKRAVVSSIENNQDGEICDQVSNNFTNILEYELQDMRETAKMQREALWGHL